MHAVRLALTTLGLAVALPGHARGDTPAPDEAPPRDQAPARRFSDITGSYQLQLALASAGPVLFRDTPNKMLETTTVFEYGGRLAFLLGNERLDAHRLGLGVSYDRAAHSDSRNLAFITPHLIVETGHPFVLQLALGAAIGTGTANFASNYTGMFTGATLRWSFLDKHRPAPVSVSFGLTGRVIAATKDLEYSSAFVGGQLELDFHFGDQGARK